MATRLVIAAGVSCGAFLNLEYFLKNENIGSRINDYQPGAPKNGFWSLLIVSQGLAHESKGSQLLAGNTQSATGRWKFSQSPKKRASSSWSETALNNCNKKTPHYLNSFLLLFQNHFHLVIPRRMTICLIWMAYTRLMEHEFIWQVYACKKNKNFIRLAYTWHILFSGICQV
jgi:hypothetical protein